MRKKADKKTGLTKSTGKNTAELSDVRAEIDALIERIVELRVHEKSLIALQIPEYAEIPLRLDEARRTIFWLGGFCKLSPKEFLFVKTLWDGKDHFAEWSVIEETVWSERFQKNKPAPFVPKNTMKVFLHRLQEKLEQSHFPYTVVSFAENHNHGTNGWCLVVTENYTKT